MIIGPLQLVLVKFDNEALTRPVVDELRAARKQGLIRLVDMLYVYKDPGGMLHEKKLTDLGDEEKAEYGLALHALMGVRVACETEGEIDRMISGTALSQRDFGLSAKQIQSVTDDLPTGGSAILVLFEHVWAVSLKAALLRAGGAVLAQGLLSPDLVRLCGMTLEKAVAAAEKIELEAAQAAAARIAEADRQIVEAGEIASAWLAEAERRLDAADVAVVSSVIAANKKLVEAEQAATERVAAAEQTAAAQVAVAEQKLAEVEAAAQAKLVEAQRIRDEAEARAAQRMEQARQAAAAAIAAGVVTAAEEMQQAEAARLEAEQHRQAAEALLAQSEEEAAATVVLASHVAAAQVQAGRWEAQATIEQGIQTAEEIKMAAAQAALRTLLDAHLIREDAARQAVATLVSAALIEQAAADEFIQTLYAVGVDRRHG